MHLGQNVLIKGFVGAIGPTSDGRTIVSIFIPDRNSHISINLEGRSLAAIEEEFLKKESDVAKDDAKRSRMIKLTSSVNNAISYIKADSIIGVCRGRKNGQDTTEVLYGPECYIHLTAETVEEVVALIDAANG